MHGQGTDPAAEGRREAAPAASPSPAEGLADHGQGTEPAAEGGREASASPAPSAEEGVADMVKAPTFPPKGLKKPPPPPAPPSPPRAEVVVRVEIVSRP